jgi:hypothetical protein
VTRCGQCHDISVVSSVRHTREQWGSIIDVMVARGMNASDTELTQIQDYLATARGPDN